MTLIQKSLLTLGITSVLFCAALILGTTNFAGASAPTGLKTSIATTSNPTVTSTAATVFATSTCDTRVITTYAAPIMITFSDYAGQTPTGTFGHLQAASSTTVYDSGQYGCGLVKIYSFATQAITVSESR